MPSIEVTTAPDYSAALAVVIDGVSFLEHLRDEIATNNTAHDTKIKRKFPAAVEYVAGLLGRSILTQTLTVLFDVEEAASPLWLPRPPVQSISSVTTYDLDDVATAVATTDYRLEGLTGATTYVDGARLVADNSGWLRERPIASVRVVYVAGYGLMGAVPPLLREGIIRRFVDTWRFRSSSIVGTIVNNSSVTLDDLLWSYRYAF